MQFSLCFTGDGAHIKGNYFYNNEQVLTAFDRVANAVIEDNIFDAGPIGRPWQIEWYSDSNSIIRHNTMVYGAKCLYNMVCGMIMVSHKTADPAGKGTQVYDNIATSIVIDSGSALARNDHNLLRTGAGSGNISGSPTYMGGASPTTVAGFQLATGSLGLKAASDGSNVGAQTFTSGYGP